MGAPVSRRWTGLIVLLGGVGLGVITWWVAPSHTMAKWENWWFAAVCGSIATVATLSGPWLMFGWYELRFGPTDLVLRRGIGAPSWRRAMPLAHVRKVERVYKVDADSGKPISSTIYVFGRRWTWRFGEALLGVTTDYLWGELSRGRPASVRTELIVPSND